MHARVVPGRRWPTFFTVLAVLAGLVSTPPTGAEELPASPEPSRDGKIVYQSNAGGDHDVWIMDGDGTGQRKLTSEPANLNEEDGEPSFARDTTRVAFASCRDDVQPVPCLLGDVTSAAGNSDIFVMLPDGTEQTPVTRNLAHDGMPHISPDGSKVVYTSIRELNADLFVVNVDGSGERRLTQNLSEDASPSWSPDGTKIAFSSNRTGDHEIYVVGDDGTGLTQLTTSPGADTEPAWSPDGSEITFVSTRNGNPDVYVMAADGSGVTQLTNDPAVDRSPTYSPDGSEIAFVSTRDGDPEIFLMNADGTVQSQVTVNDAEDLAPSWEENLSVRTSVEAVEASPASIPVGRIPLVRTSPNTTGTAGGDLPLDSIGLSPGDLSLDSIGLSPGDLTLDSIGLSPGDLTLDSIGVAPIEALKSIPLSALPLLTAPPTWQDILVGTPFAGLAEHTVSLGELLLATDDTAPTVNDVSLASLDLTEAPFGSLRFDVFLLGRTPWRDIASPFEGGWCPRFEALGFADCGADFGGLDGTPLYAQLAGMPFGDAALPIPIQAVQLGSISLADNAPARALRLSAFDLGITRLGLLTPGDLVQPDAVFDCALVDCSATSAITLFEAAGAVPSGVRAEASVRDLGTAAGEAALGELVLALTRLYPYESIPWDRLGIRSWRGERSSSVRLDARYAPVGVHRASNATVSITAPATFSFDSAEVSFRSGSDPAEAPTPIHPTAIGYTSDGLVIAFEIGREVPSGWSVTISTVLRPGGRLGSFTSNVSVAADEEPDDGAVAEERVARAPVAVIDTLEPNSADTPVAIEANVLYTSFTLKGDADVFAFPPQPRGTLITFLLGNDDIDRDLAVFGPSDAPAYRPLRDVADDHDRMDLLADDGVRFDNADAAVQPDSVDVPLIDGRHLAGLSQNRGVDDERVTILSTGGSEPYLVQVSGYNGAAAATPYTLRVRMRAPRQIGDCPAPVFAHDADPYAGLDEAASIVPAPSVVPADTRTLLLFPHARWSDTFGATSAANVLGALNDLATHDAVRGVVVPIDGDPGVRAAYEAWDAAPCEPELSNDVVRTTNRIVDSLRAAGGSGIANIVVVGDHGMSPFGAVPDLTEWGNERTYVQSMPYTVNNPLNAAAALGYLLTDDPWADLGPTAVPGGWLYTPDLAVGRLVEDETDVIAAIQAFLDSDGVLAPGSALSAATDFMKDLGEEVQRTTEQTFGANATAMIGDGWTFDQLQTAMTGSDVVAAQAHADGYRLLPPADPPHPMTTADLPSAVGRIWFTMGCHTGESRPDRFTDGGNASRDWAQTLASRTAVYVGQLGYGLGGRFTLDLSEAVVGGFGELLLRDDDSTTMTSGQALAVSKIRQLADDGAPGVYLSKALQEATLYGLPMYRVGTQSPPASVADAFAASGGSAVTPVPGEDGTSYVDVQTAPTYETVLTPEGRYLKASGHEPQSTHDRPVLPKMTHRVTAPGLRAHGVTIESYATADQSDFDPVIAKPLLAAGRAVSNPNAEREDILFPAVPGRVVRQAGQDTLVTMMGAFAGRSLSDGDVLGRHRKVTSATWRVWYSDDPDTTAPSWSTFDVEPQGADLVLRARVDDDQGPDNVAAVSALVLDESGAWRLVALERDTNDPGIFAATVPFQGPGYEVIGQLRDAAGNTRFVTDKGTDFAGVHTPGTDTTRYVMDGPYSPYLGKTVQAGSTVPVRFGLTLDGVPVVDPDVVESIATYPVDCTSLKAASGTEARSEDLSSLSIADDGTYHFNWATSKAYAGRCVAFEIALDDQTSHRVLFRFKN